MVIRVTFEKGQGQEKELIFLEDNNPYFIQNHQRNYQKLYSVIF